MSPLLVEDPLLALSVRRLGGLDVGEKSLTVNAEGIESHLVESSTGCWVVAVKFACGIEGGFLPETREVKHAERTCDSGSDGRNDLAHVFRSFWFRLEGGQRIMATGEVLAVGLMYGKSKLRGLSKIPLPFPLVFGFTAFV